MIAVIGVFWLIFVGVRKKARDTVLCEVDGVFTLGSDVGIFELIQLLFLEM